MAWLSGWNYRKLVTLSRASGAVTDYQRKLLVRESVGTQVSLLEMDGADESTDFPDTGGAHTWTPAGTAHITTAQSVFGGASAVFDGDSDYISTPYSSDFDFGSGNFTWDFWLMIHLIPGSGYIVPLGINRSGSADYVIFYYDKTANKWIFAAVVNTVMKCSYNWDWAPSTDIWYHVAIVRNGTDLSIYIDGVKQTLTVATAISTNSITPNTQNPFYVGRNGDNNNGYLNGWMDRVRITKGQALWTENFDPKAIIDCGGKCLSTFNDIRFTKSDGTTLLGYWIELITEATPNQLATVWIEFDSIGTDATTFYMYYGKADAASVSSIIDTFIKGDDGVAGNFTEAVSGTGAFSYASGKYRITEDSTDDCATAGHILGDWSFKATINEFSTFIGTTTATHQSLFGLFDSDTVANLIGTAAVAGPKRRFYFARLSSNAVTNPNKIYVLYQSTDDTFYFWTGSAWTTTATPIASSGNLVVKIWSDGTNFLCDVFSGGVSLFTSPASIAIALVKTFSSGKCLAWGDFYTDAYGITHDIDDYFIQQYLATEPAWGSWGDEEVSYIPRHGFVNFQDPGGF